MTLFDKIHPFLVSSVISLVIGIERERSHPSGSQAIGVRSFMLLGLLGTLAAFLQNSMVTAGVVLFTAALILLGYWRTSGPDADSGLTTEVSALVVFGLGFLANNDSVLALILGLTVFGVLFSRSWLHKFSRETLRPAEMQAVLILGVLLVGVVPLLPDRAIDPWNTINPRRLAGVISALAVIQFSSYVAVRMLGQKAGLMLSGFFGGLISSTSVFATFPSRAVEKPELFWSVLAAINLAALAMLLEAIAIIALTADGLLPRIGVPLTIMGATCFVIAMATGRQSADVDKGTWQAANPLDLKSVLQMALTISTMLLLISLANKWQGAIGTDFVSFLGGLFELHGVTFANATMFTQGQLSLETSTSTLSLAVAAAFISKILLLWILASGRIAAWGTVCLLLIFGTGALALFLL